MLPQYKRGLQLAAQMAILRQERLQGRMAVDRPPMGHPEEGQQA